MFSKFIFGTHTGLCCCNESVNLAKFGHEGIVKFVNGVLRGAVRSKESIVYPDAEKDPRQYLALKEFHPDWLVKRWLKQFGFEGCRLCAALITSHRL